MDTEPDHQTARYIELVNQLGDEFGKRYGWKAKVAKQLGVSRSYLSKLTKGDRHSVGAEIVSNALSSLRLDPTFFTAPAGEHYTKFVLPGYGPMWGGDDGEPMKPVNSVPIAADHDLVEEHLLEEAKRYARAHYDRAPDEELAGAARRLARAYLGRLTVREARAVLDARDDRAARAHGLHLAEAICTAAGIDLANL